MSPSMSVLTGFDCLDTLKIWRGRGLGPQQSCPVTFSFVPTGLVQVVRILISVQFFSKALKLLLQKNIGKDHLNRSVNMQNKVDNELRN